MALGAILLFSFAAKVTLRVFVVGDESFWTSGYSLFADIGSNLARTGHFFFSDSSMFWHSIRPPLYPLTIAAVWKYFGGSTTVFLFLQALWSTATIAFVYGIAKKTAGKTAGLGAALLAGFFPYSLLHDTALQESGLCAFLSTGSVYFLLSGESERGHWRWPLAAGGMMGLAILTRSSFQLPFLALLAAIGWRHWEERTRLLKTLGAAVTGMLLVLSPWLARNYFLLGVPVVSTDTGLLFAIAHNDRTLAEFPAKTIDAVPIRMYADLTAAERDRLVHARGSELSWSGAHAARGWSYIRTNPGRTVAEGLFKAIVPFTGLLSPLGSWNKNLVYFCGYWVLFGLALVGLRERPGSYFTTVLVALHGAHALSAFLFWSHTSQRSFLDPLVAVAAGVGLARLLAMSRAGYFQGASSYRIFTSSS